VVANEPAAKKYGDGGKFLYENKLYLFYSDFIYYLNQAARKYRERDTDGIQNARIYVQKETEMKST